jgi:hypothetical protein
MIGILEQNRNRTAPIPTLLSLFAKEIWSLRRVNPDATYAVRLKRSSDNAETDVELPESGFISMSSTVSAGGDLATWIGSSNGIVTKVYGQQGFKDLVYTNADLKLINNGVLLVLYPGSGIPAVLTDTYGGNGLIATSVNGSNSIDTASIFSAVRYHNSFKAENVPYGFGNINYDMSYNGGKRCFLPAGDNSLRFYGANIAANQVAAGNYEMIRTSFKNGDTYSDYINGVENIVPTIVTGTDIVDDFFINSYSNGYSNAYWSESILFLNDQSSNREKIEAEINADYQII